MKIIKTTDADFDVEFRRVLKRGGALEEEIWRTVEAIVRDVEKRGDEALFHYTEVFDGQKLTRDTVEVSPEEIKRLISTIPAEDMEMMKLAASRIERFHREQLVGDWTMEEEGIKVGQRIVPLEKVGIYCPGGRAAYPSTVLMTAIPAAVAGVKEIIMVSPMRAGEINPLVVAAAHLSGVHRVFKVGGAQAIAALAYGTTSIPAVDKIVGPGNAYVACAKQCVFGQVAIDMIAGPSEVLIVSDGTVDSSYVACDMLAQLEHDEKAAAVLITPDEDFACTVVEELEKRVRGMERKSICLKALESYGLCIVTRDTSEAIDLANLFAPEHLELMTADPESLLPRVKHAGAVFLGAYTPETLGDYLAGPNHVLPTGGTARFSSALGVYDFIKRISVLSFSQEGVEKLGPAAQRFAVKEGLTAHAKAVEIRLKKEGKEKS